MSIEDSLANTKIMGSKITPTWMNNVQDALGNGYASQGPTTIIFYDPIATEYKARNGLTGKISTHNTDYADIIQETVNTETANGGVIYVRSPGVFTKYVQVKANIQIVGNGRYSRLTKASDYAGGFGAFFNLQGSNTSLTNFWLEGQGTSPNQEKLVTVNPAAVNIENVKIRDIYLHDSGYQGIVAASAGAGTTTDIDISNCIVDNSAKAAFVFGPGVAVGRIRNCRAIEPGHSGVDIWGCDRYTLVENCEILKTVHTLGGGIYVTSIPDALPEHDTQEVIIRNNRIKGAMEFDGICVHSNGEHVVADGNMVDGATRNGIVVMAFAFGGTNYYGKNVTIVNNDVRNVGSKPGNGIVIYGNGLEATVNENIIANNRILNAGVYGIEVYDHFRCAVTGNVINLPARTTANSSGIVLYHARRCTVTGNIIYGDANVDYGIEEIGLANYNAIVGNVSNKPYLIIGDNTQDGHNV